MMYLPERVRSLSVQFPLTLEPGLSAEAAESSAAMASAVNMVKTEDFISPPLFWLWFSLWYCRKKRVFIKRRQP